MKKTRVRKSSKLQPAKKSSKLRTLTLRIEPVKGFGK